MFERIKAVLFEEARAAGLSEFDVYFTQGSNVSAEAQNREVGALTSGTAGGVCFRCAVNGKLGAASSQCVEEREVRSLVRRAMENAAVTDDDEPPIFFAGADPADYRQVDVTPPLMPTVGELREVAMALQEQLYAASPLMCDGTSTEAGAGVREISLANSHGVMLSHRAGMQYAVAEAVVREGEEPSFGFATAPVAAAGDLAARATREALARLGATRVPTGTYDVIFSAKQMRALLGAFCGIFSGKAALLGLSLLAGKEGSAVAAPCLTLIDDPFYKENPMQRPFDAEGVPTSEKKLIQNGVLNTLLYDLTNARKAGCGSTGNASRPSPADPVTISPYCLRVAPGEYSPDALLQRLGDGLYITELKGLHAGADAVTGDVSIESAGFLVKDGKRAGPVRGFTVAGNFFKLLFAVDGVADNVEMGLPATCVMAAPDVLVRGISVAGE